MLIFIDESGDVGFSKGASDVFVIALITFNTSDAAIAADKLIESLKINNRVWPEYKFAKTSDNNRHKFFTALRGCAFCISVIVVNKAKVRSQELKTQPKRFYDYFLKQSLQRVNLSDKVIIKADKTSSKAFQREIKNSINKEISAKIKLTFEDSRANNLIQLADMIAGAIMRSYNLKKKDGYKWLEYLNEKEINLLEFK